MVFSWLPRNTSSPNSAASTAYLFQLFEVRVPGQNANDVVLSQTPVFQTTTPLTQLLYGPSEPPLLEGMNYVWRVQAIDEQGKDAFRNQGYSEVCVFSYGGADQRFQVGLVEDFQAEALAEKLARFSWKEDPARFDTYQVSYQKKGATGDWLRQQVSGAELRIHDLEPDSEYEARLQGKKGSF